MMNSEQRTEYQIRQNKRVEEIVFAANKRGYMLDSEKLEMMKCYIAPYSRWWRYGMVSALKKAIKLLKENGE